MEDFFEVKKTKSEKREKNKRKKMPMHGRNTAQVYNNAITKRYNEVKKKENR